MADGFLFWKTPSGKLSREEQTKASFKVSQKPFFFFGFPTSKSTARILHPESSTPILLKLASLRAIREEDTM